MALWLTKNAKPGHEKLGRWDQKLEHPWQKKLGMKLHLDKEEKISAYLKHEHCSSSSNIGDVRNTYIVTYRTKTSRFLMVGFILLS